ncbi:MAG: DUF4367 domain-containing protein [Aminipila sp.]
MINMDGKNHLFDVLFRQAIIDNYEEELISIPNEKELSALYSFSDTHNARMKELFLREKRFVKLKNVQKWVRRCVAAIFVVAVILFSLAMTVPEVRAAVKSVIIEWYDKFTQFTSDQKLQKEPQSEAQIWEPSYMIEGFAENERHGKLGQLTIVYYDLQSNIITFSYINQSNSIFVDNEDRKYYEREEKGVIYYIFEAEDSNKGNTIVWDKGDYRFSVNGQSPVSELLKIAESIEKSKKQS